MTVHTDSIILLPDKELIAMLNLLVKEYLAICEYLLELEKRRQETEELPLVRKGQLLVDKDILTCYWIKTSTKRLRIN